MDARKSVKDEVGNKKNIVPKIPAEKKDVIQNTLPEKKDLLETQLRNGVKIQNQEHYEGFMNLLQKHSIIKTFPSFHVLNDLGEGTNPNLNHFLIQKKEGSNELSVFLQEIDTLTYKKPSETYYQLATIDQNGTYKKNASRDITYHIPQSSPEKKPNTFQPSQDSLDLALGIINEKTLQKGETIEQIYTIKAGDSLWKIVKNIYNLGENTQENSTKIANIIKVILKTNPHIKDINKIYVGQKIRFPQVKK